MKRPLFTLSLLMLTAGLGRAQSVEERLKRLEEENESLRLKIDALSDEVERVDLGDAFVPVGQSIYGLGPAASKVYSKDQGLSIGGYGEFQYENLAGSGDEADLLRAVTYIGYKFNDDWVFNSELEFEHAGTGGGGSTSVELAYLDRLIRDEINVRAGLVLAPMGFVNELHEPTTFLSANRPITETRIMPSTWRENAVGIFGDVGPVAYRAYLINGFDGLGFSAAGLRGGRQRGSEALADDLAFVLRADWTPVLGTLIGGSFYTGGSGQDQGVGNVTTNIYEVHASVEHQGLLFRALYTMATVDDVEALNAAGGLVGAQSVGEELNGGYVEAGYDVLSLLDEGSSWRVEPYARWETIDTQAEVPSGFASDPANDFDVTTFGVRLVPHPQIVIKLDYADFDPGTDRWNFLVGYTF